MLNFSSFLCSAAVRLLLAILLLAGGLSAAAQAPAWQSAQTVAVATAAATTNYSEVNATAVDAAGNVYLAGIFWNTVILGGTTLTSLGGSDIFVAKFNPTSNQFVWAERGGGTYSDIALALTMSGTSVYVGGYFNSPTVGFGTTTLANAGATTGTNDVFVAKLTDAGNTGSFVWAQRAGGAGDDGASALAANGTSVYVAGSFASSSAAFGSSTLTSAGSGDVFVAKLTDASNTGSFVWAQQAGGAGGDGANALAVSGTSVYVAGYFGQPTASFGTTTLTSVSTGFRDAFVAKLTDAGSTGSFAWAQQAGGAGSDVAQVLAVSGTSVYVAGYFQSSTADFGTITLTALGFAGDGFVAKLRDTGSTGSFVWAQQASSINPLALALSGNSVYIAGNFSPLTADFGVVILTNPNPNGPIAFLASLTDPTLTATAPASGTAFSLYPNPAHRTATLCLPAGAAPAPLILCDAQGHTVRCYPAPVGTETILDLYELPAGLYLLRGAGPAQRLVVE
jgi:hypothetical protein